MSFVSSLLTSVLASFIFLFIVLILYKPKLRVSPHICKGKFQSSDPNDYYFIKIVNTSIFSAYDINMELFEIDKYPTTNGQMNVRHKPLSLVLSKVSNIDGYKPGWITKNASYAVRVRTSENLNAILMDDYKSVIIKISLRHGLTGLVKVITQEYTDCSQIKKGKFEYGRKF